MKKYSKYIVITGVVVVGLLVYYFAYGGKVSKDTVGDLPGQRISAPSATPPKNSEIPKVVPDPVAKPTETPKTTPTKVAPTPQPIKEPTFTLSGVSGRNASGTGSIITTTEGTFIRLNEDFVSSVAAPDNRVYLGDENGFQIEISKLKSPSGAQNFLVPSNIDSTKYAYVWIHCKAYSVTYGKAQIIR